jgi:glycine/D-amino acid oxidase-like deaminating enzyme
MQGKPRVASRAGIFVRLLLGLRKHDLRAARNWISTMYPGEGLLSRLVHFCAWALDLVVVRIYRSRQWATFASPVSHTPIWLAAGNPFDNFPFRQAPDSRLPDEAEVVVIGAGLIGGALAYHWSKLGSAPMVVIEANEVASGAAGRNEGLVVMGRHYQYVYKTVLGYLDRERSDMSEAQRHTLANEFATAYVNAAYENAKMIAETVQREQIDCDYVRKGWVQVPGPSGVRPLEESTRIAKEAGFTDWIKISSAEVYQRSGLRTSQSAGFSIGAATWHPAKWVWGLMTSALRSPNVQLFSRTKVLKVEDDGERYVVHTSRGMVLARHVVNATESLTPLLFPEFHDVIIPTQTQAAFGESDGGTMKCGVGISSDRAFYGRHRNGILFGSDATRVPDNEAGQNRPSRFITSFVITEMESQFSIKELCVTNEWSGTVSYTPDEFPLVGLMDGKRAYMIGGMAGSGSAVSFNAARHIVQLICGVAGPDFYPEKYFSPARFRMHPMPESDSDLSHSISIASASAMT